MCSKAIATHHSAPTGSKLTPPPTFANKQLPVATLLHLATLGGAQVCALEGRVGSFTPGKAFDALLVSVRSDAGNPGLWGADLDDELNVQREKTPKLDLEGMLERFLFCGDDRNIRRVYVQGKRIGGAEQRK
jgi:guanine deaminase